MHRSNVFLVLSVASGLFFTSACTSQVNSFLDASQVSDTQGAAGAEAAANLYETCHRKWMKNGFINYTFKTESGKYHPDRPYQTGLFQDNVVRHSKLASTSSCVLIYGKKSSYCKPGSQRKVKGTGSIAEYFSAWKQNPSLYKTCHPILGYPLGYGHVSSRGNGRQLRPASETWLIISQVKPAKDNPGSPGSVLAEKAVTQQMASLTDLEISLKSSRISKAVELGSANTDQQLYVNSNFDVVNPTKLPALLKVKGWLLDKNFNRYPLYVNKQNAGESQAAASLKVPPQTNLTVTYKAEGPSNIEVGPEIAALLEFSDSNGVKTNLSLPRQ
jgi:hypothetical protein